MDHLAPTNRATHSGTSNATRLNTYQDGTSERDTTSAPAPRAGQHTQRPMPDATSGRRPLRNIIEHARPAAHTDEPQSKRRKISLFDEINHFVYLTKDKGDGAELLAECTRIKEKLAKLESKQADSVSQTSHSAQYETMFRDRFEIASRDLCEQQATRSLRKLENIYARFYADEQSKIRLAKLQKTALEITKTNISTLLTLDFLSDDLRKQLTSALPRLHFEISATTLLQDILAFDTEITTASNSGQVTDATRWCEKTESYDKRLQQHLEDKNTGSFDATTALLDECSKNLVKLHKLAHNGLTRELIKTAQRARRFVRLAKNAQDKINCFNRLHNIFQRLNATLAQGRAEQSLTAQAYNAALNEVEHCENELQRREILVVNDI